MRVKQIDNVLDLFEVFARDGEPMTLTAVAKALSVPKSSAFNIIETLVQRGYLYETRRRGGYYPTALLNDISWAITDADPLVQRLHPELVALASVTGETVVLSVREQNEIVYIDVVESASSIRYFARIGHRRPLHTTSSGKAILSSYGASELAHIFTALRETSGDGLSANGLDALRLEIAACVERGWAEDKGDTMPDVMGLGVPVHASGRRFGLALAGPVYRMQGSRDNLVAQLMATRENIMTQILG